MATETEQPPRISNRDLVLTAVRDLCWSNRPASRHAICKATGLKMSIVDDHVKKLKADGLIQLVVNGVFEPVEQIEDRALSVTFLANSRIKVEIGDSILELTLREARNLGSAFAGMMMQFGRH